MISFVSSRLCVNFRITAIYFMAALTASIPMTYGQVPNVKFESLTISVRTDIRGFQGPKPAHGDFIEYSVTGQSFLPDGIDLKIPVGPMDFKTVDSLLTNPYTTLLASLHVDKVSEKAGRIALSAPECRESIMAMLEDASSEKINQATQKLMEGVEGIRLLLLIKDEQSGRSYAYYRLVKSAGNTSGPVYIRSFENIHGLYFTSCAPIDNPMPLNIWNALISGKESYAVK